MIIHTESKYKGDFSYDKAQTNLRDYLMLLLMIKLALSGIIIQRSNKSTIGTTNGTKVNE